MTLRNLETLSRSINTMMGESVGNYMLDQELRRLKISRENVTEQDMHLLTENLKQSFEPLLGKDGINWLLSADQ